MTAERRANSLTVGLALWVLLNPVSGSVSAYRTCRGGRPLSLDIFMAQLFAPQYTRGIVIDPRSTALVLFAGGRISHTTVAVS